MTDAGTRGHYGSDHEAFRAAVRDFIGTYVSPNVEEWTEQRLTNRTLFKEAAAHGLLGLQIAAAHGGQGHADYRYNQVLLEELELAGVGSAGTGIMLQNDIVLPYLDHLATAEQRARWIGPVCSGDFVGALAITEQDAGSDVAAVGTSAVRDGDEFVVNGSKTFIGCGIHADFVLVVVRTSDERHRGLTLLVVEDGMPGFTRAGNLERAGRQPQDVAELHFTDVRVPMSHVLGEVGGAFGYLMHNLALERLQVAISAVAATRYMLGLAVDRAAERQVFGAPLSHKQHWRFSLAEIATEVEMAQAFVDMLVTQSLTGPVAPDRAAMAKWWCTEMQNRAAATCMQLFGGAGYIGGSRILTAWQDARVTTIYGGTTEVMKEIIARDLW